MDGVKPTHTDTLTKILIVPSRAMFSLMPLHVAHSTEPFPTTTTRNVSVPSHNPSAGGQRFPSFGEFGFNCGGLGTFLNCIYATGATSSSLGTVARQGRVHLTVPLVKISFLMQDFQF